MHSGDKGFVCIASGSFSQDNEQLFGWSNNVQCVANSACALAWKFVDGIFTSHSIDSILLSGDRLYKSVRNPRVSGEERLLYPEELPRDFDIFGRRVHIDVSEVHYGLYPQNDANVDDCVKSLSEVLQELLSTFNRNVGYLFTGQHKTISFWNLNNELFLFDSHAVDCERRHDLENKNNNLARLFQCDSCLSLARLLLLDGRISQFTVTRLTVSQFEDQLLLHASQSTIYGQTTSTSRNSISVDPKLLFMKPVVLLSRLESLTSEKTNRAGRPKKRKRGRPKTLLSSREEQVRESKKKYAAKNPDIIKKSVRRYSQEHRNVNREAVRRYTAAHPEVNQEAVRRYTQDRPEINRGSVRRYNERNPLAPREKTRQFRQRNPERKDLRHVSSATARKIVCMGPMAYWQADALHDIHPYNLKKSSLWDDGIYRCPHCQARLFDEEKDRKKWCCGQGSYNVLRLPPLTAPFYLNKDFLKRARAYNDLFAFCALEVSGGYRHPSGIAFFKIEGKMYHQVHSLEAPGQKFRTKNGNVQFVNRCRLYIDDGEERINIAMGRSLSPRIINEIEEFLRGCNPFIKDFKKLSDEPSIEAHLTFQVTSRSTHGPTLGDRHTGIEVHAVLSNDDSLTHPRQLTIWKRSEQRPSSIDLLSPLMEPFQYPLLYPEGEIGWYIGRIDNHGRKLTQFTYSRCLLLSDPRFSHTGRLSQAWQVEMFARYEEERLRFIRFSQHRSNTETALRVVPLDELVEAERNRQRIGQVMQDLHRDETVQGEGGVQPGKVYLPSSFTGGPRYMKVHYENAMGLVSRLGSPTFFLTFTYSANWVENKKACPHGTGLSDPATACRIFQIKLGELMRDIRSGAFFGKPLYIVYVIEMQMRGLPHAHIVFKIDGDDPVQAHEIDSVIRATIPSELEAGGRLRDLVLKNMVHGPCGSDYRTEFPCWDADKGYCTKFYPKPACQTTHVDDRGFVQYRRDYRNEGVIKTRQGDLAVHDGWVVPYNPALLLKYEAHINLEISSTRRVIKYLFKYLMKGGSLQNVTVTPLGRQEDEVEHYVTKRMVGASDACWRLLDFPISKSEPTVECLPVHLQGKQSIVFRPHPSDQSEVISRATSKLIIYFDRPYHHEFEYLTYQSFYENYVVHTKRPNENAYEHPDGQHFITSRQRGHKVCRIHWVSPNRGELYYLRILLMSINCRGYEDLLSRGGNDCRTFQDLARTMGLIEDEEEYNHVIREASTFMVGYRLRSLFVLLCNMGAPAALLWETFKDSICEDLLERHRENPERAYKLALIDIDRSLRRQGSCLTDHGLPYVKDNTTELDRELDNYGMDQQTAIVKEWEPKLSEDQRRIYEYFKILYEKEERRDQVIFIDGPGGYGKTALIRVILAYVRSHRQVALAVASSGIAAANMPGGTTAHSMFGLPLDLREGTGVWNITNGSQRADLIRKARVIVFDEAPMAHKFIFGILDRSLRDLMNSNKPFGGKIFISSGDFRQIAPVVRNARTPGDVTCVSLRSSPLWSFFRVFSLTTPQRTSASMYYSNFLLGVGNGTIPPFSFGKELSLIPLRGIRSVASLKELLSFVFPETVVKDPELCARRAILSTLNVNVNEINRLVLHSSPGRIHELRSADTVDKEDNDGLDIDVHLLNQASGSGVPDHILHLKVGSVCLVMRNLNIGDGLVNGTKVIVTAISNRLITVRKPGNNQPIAIPRITFSFPFMEGSPLRVRRRQFPLTLAYCMTSHKSQGQTIDYVGVDLRTDCFTHGQLYVLLSRVRSPEDIVVHVPCNRVIDGVAYVKNIVFEDLLL
ncbi:uncharacterized protein LOC124159723 [Ischnura elegans]|uniref:uncharacterized protein LOC124159721 n=1 Tax=Ischnura elegans TaxID=197161 RepID=UPI001ED8AC21|nr:uncharacterized protein LOC124159721 [Ischnura elegans]XP_046391589.1 uncharacterized protein LOC124159722 [Ischnura elegans]XP_046391590.1 uncharacterized protein LOC124159723 [Ischnura elegans]